MSSALPFKKNIICIFKTLIDVQVYEFNLYIYVFMLLNLRCKI